MGRSLQAAEKGTRDHWSAALERLEDRISEDLDSREFDDQDSANLDVEEAASYGS
jgi:hypothetical protein